MSQGEDQDLRSLYDATVKALLKKIENGEANASDLNVARQLLKDNGIQAIAEGHQYLQQLISEVPDDLDEQDPGLKLTGSG